jgi:hypothetical protein
MMTVDTLRAGVHDAARALLATGPRTMRALYRDDRLWAAIGAGWSNTHDRYWADVWLEEVAEPLGDGVVTQRTLYQLRKGQENV